MTAIKILTILLIALTLSGCDSKEKNKDYIPEQMPKDQLMTQGSSPITDLDKVQIEKNETQEDEIQEEKLEASLLLLATAYFPDNSLNAKLIITNTTKNKADVWLELKLINDQGDEVYSSIQSSQVLSQCYLEQEISFPAPQLVLSGSYKARMTAWNGRPGTEGSYLLDESRSEQNIVFYQKQENFDYIDENIWEISNKRLGRSSFRESNVTVVNGILTIRMPDGKLEGGEIASKEQFGYGVYEVRMKLPNVPSSITGFFLYEIPDYYYEIDIEIYNTSEGQVMLTTYADGAVQNQLTTNLGFDPTEDFHDYRIEYRRDRLNFYVDNEFVKGWSEGLPKDKMRLMINVWYPKWLEGSMAQGEQSLLIDWLRY